MAVAMSLSPQPGIAALVLAGIVLGIIDAMVIRFIIKKWDERRAKV